MEVQSHAATDLVLLRGSGERCDDLSAKVSDGDRILGICNEKKSLKV